MIPEPPILVAPGTNSGLILRSLEALTLNNERMILRILLMALIIIAIISVFGFVFNVLFKVGLLVLLVLGVAYLFKKTFVE